MDLPPPHVWVDGELREVIESHLDKTIEHDDRLEIVYRVKLAPKAEIINIHVTRDTPDSG